MDSFSGLVNNSALLMTLCVIYDIFGVYDLKNKNLKDFTTGALVGFVAIAVMLNPWSLEPGVFFDTRWVLLSLSGLFFGLRPTAIAVVVAVLFRLQLGGLGSFAGSVVIVVTAGIGIAWKYWKDKQGKTLNWKQLYVFGVIIQLAMLSCMILMPANIRMQIIKSIAPTILLIYPFLTMIIGLILKRQEDRRATTKELAENKITLATEKERLAVTLRSIGDGVITTDILGNILLLNKAAETLTGWNHKDAINRPLKDVLNIVDKQTRESLENPVTKVLTNRQTVELTKNTLLISKNGSYHPIADSAAPIFDSQSNIVGVVLVFRDIAKQLKAEQEILKSKKLESIGLLAGGIAHDFNNILTAILGNINLALFDNKLDHRTKKLLSEAEKASNRAKDLTQQLLTFAKGGEPVKKTSSLEDVIKDSANFVLHGDKVACQFNIPDDLCLVDIDKGQISQVIQNIVINASHSMPEVGTITITCENVSSSDNPFLPRLEKNEFVKISIQDEGIGMSPNIVEKIFDPYFSTKQTGSGLGLSITHSIITKHNGHISVNSSPGIGTTFNIYLPASEHENVESHKSEDLIVSPRQAKILIMDDEELVRDIAKAMLNKLGHEIISAADGAEAVELYKDSLESGKPFDLVIMDLTIPGGMGGEEAMQKVLNIDPSARVIVSSGYSNDPIMAKCKDYGFCSAIVKPYQLHELSRVIALVLN